MDAVQKRLACLIASSAILHAAALVPLKVSKTPSRQPFSPRLTVDLPARESQPAAPRVPLATAPVEAPRAAPVETVIPRTPTDELAAANPDTAHTRDMVRRDPPTQPIGPLAPTKNESANNPDPKPLGGVRTALPEEVSVRALLLSYEADQNPSDTVLVQGKTYVYFKSPSLLRAAQPLDDTKPHYPARKPDYIHGAVQLRLLIDEAGKLERVVVLCSNPTFEKSALASIEHMRFTPAQSVSGPVPSYMVVEFGYGRGFPCTTVPDLSPSK